MKRSGFNRLSGSWPAAALLLAAALLGGCLEKKDYDEIRYYRTVQRDSSGITRGVGEVTRKQAGTQAHWRFYITDGRAERMESYDETTALMSEIRVTFDAKGRVADERTYNPDKKLVTKLAITYDEQGRVSGFKHYTADAGLMEERQWEYDEQGRLKEVRVYSHHGVLRRLDEFVYNKKKPTELLGVRRYGSQREPIEQIPAADYNYWE